MVPAPPSHVMHRRRSTRRPLQRGRPLPSPVTSLPTSSSTSSSTPSIVHPPPCHHPTSAGPPRNSSTAAVATFARTFPSSSPPPGLSPDSVRSSGTAGRSGRGRGRAAQGVQWPTERRPVAAAPIQRPGRDGESRMVTSSKTRNLEAGDSEQRGDYPGAAPSVENH